MTGSAVRLSKIAKGYGGSQVLRDIDLAINAGEFMTLVGPSGCGKSTLLKILAGLDQADGGSIEIGGRVVNGLRPSQRNIAMVFQSYALYPHMRVRDNLAMPLIMANLPFVARMPVIGGLVPGMSAKRRQINSTVGEVSKSLGMEALLERKPSELSGGQRQRVALGRAMVRQPGVFLMDEPLSNLDAALRTQVRTELVELQRRLNATFLYVTHDQVEAMTMSGKIAIMMDGAIVQVATPAVIYAAPADVRVARFIGSPPINILPAEIGDRGELHLFGESQNLRTGLMAGDQAQIGIRPEDVTFVAQTHLRGACPYYEGRIRLIENLGNEVILYLMLAGDKQIPVTARLPQREWSQIREKSSDPDLVRVGLSPERFLVFNSAGRLLRSEEVQISKRLEAVS
ncbi:ABC transporter ATP-binding protein [Sinorhizobium sp. 7-81]|uniref:ABC transporter ATP-binding protein n=1 Tax=Sinorhizobium sp. 8-89 TaxID=3049089 RepID=UPI0024C32372|nr:ABC transporter ATP-binding protein [Sinorhizobium sp. 8-89]MDK1494251.1 ABC transporter ATP-binding protein [Sinorhizobium sp. 8-89]